MFLGLVPFGARDKKRQKAVVVFGLDLVWVDLHRNDKRAVKYAGQALAPVEAHILPVVDLLAPSDPDRVFLGAK